MLFGLTESYVEHDATGRRIPKRIENGELALRLDARRSTEPSKSVSFGVPADENEPREPGFGWQAWRGHVDAVRTKGKMGRRAARDGPVAEVGQKPVYPRE